jgi:hypothetical protein
MHRSLGARKVALLAPAACLALALPVPLAGAAEGTITYEHESQKAYEQQLASGQIQSAQFNKRVRSLHLTLKDGRRVLYKYPPKDQPTLAAQLAAKRVPTTVLTPAQATKATKKAPVHHKLRYIAGGILIAVIVVVGAVLLIDRRRKATLE